MERLTVGERLPASVGHYDKVFVLRLGVVVVVVEDLLRTSLLMKERKEYTTAVLLIYLSGHLDHQPGDSRNNARLCIHDVLSKVAVTSSHRLGPAR